MTDIKVLTSRIKELIIIALKLEIPVEEIHDDMQMINGGLFLDSVSSMQLIVMLEEEYSINFDADDLSFENINSIEKMARYIAGKMGRPNE
jgi:acyl carrier protein